MPLIHSTFARHLNFAASGAFLSASCAPNNASTLTPLFTGLSFCVVAMLILRFITNLHSIAPDQGFVVPFWALLIRGHASSARPSRCAQDAVTPEKANGSHETAFGESAWGHWVIGLHLIYSRIPAGRVDDHPGSPAMHRIEGPSAACSRRGAGPSIDDSSKYRTQQSPR